LCLLGIRAPLVSTTGSPAMRTLLVVLHAIECTDLTLIRGHVHRHTRRSWRTSWTAATRCAT
jgi:hypothetical protein